MKSIFRDKFRDGAFLKGKIYKSKVDDVHN